MSKAIGPGSEALVVVGFFDQVVHRIEGVIDRVFVGSKNRANRRSGEDGTLEGCDVEDLLEQLLLAFRRSLLVVGLDNHRHKRFEVDIVQRAQGIGPVVLLDALVFLKRVEEVVEVALRNGFVAREDSLLRPTNDGLAFVQGAVD